MLKRAAYPIAGVAFAMAASSLSNVAKADLYWDINGTDAGATNDGAGSATGVWDDITTPNWSTDSTGGSATQTWATGNTAFFSAGTNATGTSTVTITAGITIPGVSNITFEEGTVTIAGGAGAVLTLGSGGGTGIINVAPATATISALISGADGLTKTGTGTLTLSNTTNNFTGTVKVSAGTLAISNNLNLGDAANSITMDGGTLKSTSLAATMTRAISLAAGGGTFEMAGNASTFSGVISGAGNLTKTGTTTLVLGTANNYSGQTIISTGTVVSNGINSLGDASGTNSVVLAGGILRTSSSYNETRAINLTANSSLDSSAATVSSTFSGPITGAFTLTKITAGTLTFTGTNTYDATTVTGGTSIFNSAASLPNYNVSGKVTNATANVIVAVSAGGGGQWSTADIDTFLTTSLTPAGQLGKFGINVDAANTYTHPSVLSNGTSVLNFSKVGAGTLTLSGNNNYTGTTTVDGGTLILTATGMATTGTYTANSGGTLFINNASGSGTGLSNATAANGGTVGGNGIVTNAGNSVITINSGGTLSPGSAGAGSIGTLTTDRLNLANGASLATFDLGAPGTSDKVVTTFTGVTGTTGLTLTGGVFTFLNAGGLAAGTYTILDYNGVLGGGVGNLSVNGTASAAGFDYDIVNNATATTIELNVTTAAATSNTANSWALDSVATTESPQWAQSVGSWAVGANWSNGSVPFGVDTPVTFGATTPNGQPHFIRAGSGAGKTVGSLTFNTATSNPYNNAYIISGGAPIVLDVSAGTAGVTVTTGRHQINTPMVLNDTTIFNISAGAMFSSGDFFSGTGGVTKTGAGILDLSPARANTYTGTTTVSSGWLRGSLNGINSAVTLAGGALSIFRANGTINGAVSGSGTFGWVYLPSGTAFQASTINVNNTFVGGFNAQGTLLTFSGANGGVNAATSVEMLQGSLILNNGSVNQNRIGNSAPVTLRGAELSLIGNAATNIAETIGQLRPSAGGDAFITISSPGTTTGIGATLTASSWAPQSGGLGIVRGAAVGADSAGTAFTNLKFTTAPTATGGGTPSATAIPNMYVENAAANTGTTAGLGFYDTFGVRQLTAAEYTDTAATGVNYLPTAAATVTGLTLSSLKLGGVATGASTAGGFTTTMSGTVTLTSGTIFSNSTSASTIAGGTLNFGASGALNGSIFNTNTVTISSAIKSTGFAKGGAGNLTLTGANNFLGGAVSFNGGIVTVNSTARLSNAGSVHIGADGYLVAQTTSVRSAQLSLTSATGNYTAPLFIYANHPIGTVNSLTTAATFNGNSGNNTWSGDISLMGMELNTGNGMYPGISALGIGSTLTLSGVIQDGLRTDGTPISTAFYTQGQGDLVLTGSSPNTFSNFMRPFGTRIIVEKDGAFGGGNAYNDNLGVVMTQGAATTNSRSTIAFRAPASASAGFNYSTFEWILFGGIGMPSASNAGITTDGTFLQNLGGANTFAGGIGFGSEFVEAGFTNSFHIEIQGSSSLTLSGPLAGRTASARDIQKDGTGALIITGNNSGNPPASSPIGTGSRFFVNSGSLTVAGTAGQMPAGFSTYVVGAGASLTLDNAAGVSTTRIAGTSRVSLNGGELKLNGNASNSVTQSISGGIDIGGFSIMTVTTPGASTTLNAGAFSRSNRGTVLLRGMNNSNTFIASTSTADLRGLGGGAGSTTISILPYAVGDTNATGTGTDFVTIDSGNIRALSNSGPDEYTHALDADLHDGNEARNNVNLTSSPATLSADKSANGLKISGASTALNLGTQKLLIASGGLLVTSTGSPTISGGTINFDNVSIQEGEEGTVLALVSSEEGVITVPATGNTLTISSTIAGAKGITKSGFGDVVLTGTNTYGVDPIALTLDPNARTTINAGKLSVSNDGALGNVGVPIYLNGGTLGATATFTTPASRTITLASVLANTIEVGALATTELTVDGKVSGSPVSNSLTKTGAGILTLTDLTNNYTGPTNIVQGYMTATTSQAQPQWGTGTVALKGGSVRGTTDLTLRRAMITSSTNTTGGFYVATGTTMTWNDDITTAATITGAGNIAVEGGGTLVFGKQLNQHSYSGHTYVTGAGTTLAYFPNTAATPVTTNGLPAIPGALDTAYWTLSQGGKFQLNVSSTGLGDFGSSLRGFTLGTGGGIIEVVGTNSFSSQGGINGSGSLTKTGAGQLSLRARDTVAGNGYSGNIIISAGILSTSNQGQALTSGNTETMLGTGTDASVGTNFMKIADTAEFIPLFNSINMTMNTGRSILLLGGTPVLGSGSGGIFTINGVVTGTANLQIDAQGTGKVVLAGANNYTGDTIIKTVSAAGASAGTLAIGADNSLPTGTTLRFDARASGMQANFDLNNFNQTVAAVVNSNPGVGTPSITNSSTNIRTFTVNNAASNTIDFPITNRVALTKTGAGTLIISGSANNYTGNTTVSAGAVNSVIQSGVNGALPAATTLVLTNGSPGVAQFDINSKTQTVTGIAGNGTVTDTGGAGALTVTGSVTPGTSPGTLTTNTATLLGTGAALNYDLANTNTVGGGVNDLLVSSTSIGGTNVSYTLNINAYQGDVANAVYTLIDGVTNTLDASKFAVGTNNASGSHNYAFSVSSGDLLLTITSAGPNQWKDVDGSWGTAANWTNTIVPNAVDDVALFGLNPPGASVPRTVTVEANKTVGTITFNNTNKYTLNGPGTIHVSSATTGLIDNVLGSHDINAPVVLDSNTTFGVQTGTLKLASLTATGKNVTKTGSGVLEVNKISGNALDVQGGSITMTESVGSPAEVGAPANASSISSLSMSTGTQLDLKNNNLIIRGADSSDGNAKYAAAELLVKTGFGTTGFGDTFDWNGTGIRSSDAAFWAQVDVSRMLGILNNQEFGYTDVEGDAIGTNDVLVKYTWNGDATCNGIVDPDDFNQFVFGFNGGPAEWLNGDFDYDGVVGPDDFNAFIAGFNAFNASSGTQLSDSFRAELADFASANGIPLVLDPGPVPEPSSAAVVGLIGAGMLARRRRAKVDAAK